MAWIESHQELGAHPKVRKLAVLLGVPAVQAIGHLHMLWWWALDYAEDGDLSHYDAADIALAVDWEGDPDQLVAALVDCGPGDKAGFLDPDMRLHDWHDYAGKLVERRRRDRERKAEARGQSTGRPKDVRRTSSGQAKEGRTDGVRTQPNRTQQNNTEQNHAVEVIDDLRDSRGEPSTPTQRKRDPIWDALVDVFGEPKTKTATRLRGKVAASLRTAGATPDEIYERANRWPAHFDTAVMTDAALEKHWHTLGRAPLRATKGQVRHLDAELEKRRRRAQLTEGEDPA